MKQIIRLTESELQQALNRSVAKILREDILGNDWNVNNDDLPFDTPPYPDNYNDEINNNYEPFGDEEGYDPIEADPESYMDLNHDEDFYDSRMEQV